jgi:hypothetical protein
MMIESPPPGNYHSHIGQRPHGGTNWSEGMKPSDNRDTHDIVRALQIG